MPGVKHLIECHCVLKIYDQGTKTQYHKFPVYSKLNESGDVIPKYAKCNNCESLHYVNDYCRSELKGGNDQTEVTVDIDDIVLSLPERLVSALVKLNCDISTYEHCLDVIEENRWNEPVVIKRDVIDENQHVKILLILSENKFKIQNKVINSTIML